jgi:hypothetical protein
VRKITAIFSLLTALAVLSSCSKDVLHGSGATISDTRTLVPFESVEIVGNRDVEIIPSAESKVEITGYENLVPAYTAKVSQGRLYFEFPYHAVVKNDNIRLKIYTPGLKATKLVGNNNVLVKSGITTDNFMADLTGNAKLRFEPNHFNKLEVRMSGNAEVFAEPAIARRADVQVSGNGYVEVRASESIRVQVSGSGEVNYWGSPADTDISISGRGKAIRH